ncbi:hypothetical protein [Streptomyces sp. NPDC005953]|uniref:hypothetical protein n=1 Tax=Streptomyces sp. NPDC005953 TaxID=3156719 RepID=UPI0033D56A2D
MNAGARTGIATSFTALMISAALLTHGATIDSLPTCLAGLALTLVALTSLVLIFVRHWTSDTRAERARLGEATRDASAVSARYLAAQAALDSERQRLLRDTAAERERCKAQLEAERAALLQEFEESRARIACEAFEAAVVIWRKGIPKEAQHAKVIGFPTQERERERERPRSRDVIQP